MTQVVYCTVPTDRHAARVVRALEHAGYLDSNLSMLPTDSPQLRRKARTYATRVLAYALGCAAVGSVLGAMLGWIASLVRHTLFDVNAAGSHVGSGPSVAVWIGAVVGAAAGSLIGSLIGLGGPAAKARTAASANPGRSVLVSVLAVEGQQIAAVQRLLERAGGVLISTDDALHAPPRPAPDATAYA